MLTAHFVYHKLRMLSQGVVKSANHEGNNRTGDACKTCKSKADEMTNLNSIVVKGSKNERKQATKNQSLFESIRS